MSERRVLGEGLHVCSVPVQCRAEGPNMSRHPCAASERQKGGGREIQHDTQVHSGGQAGKASPGTNTNRPQLRPQMHSPRGPTASLRPAPNSNAAFRASSTAQFTDKSRPSDRRKTDRTETAARPAASCTRTQHYSASMAAAARRSLSSVEEAPRSCKDCSYSSA